MRYAEEVELVEEEMRRVLQYLRWRAGWWRSLVGLRDALQPDTALREGHFAYACKQAAYMEGLAARFEATWKDVPGYLRDPARPTQLYARTTRMKMEKSGDRRTMMDSLKILAG
jgi:hypothetical protein